MALLTINGTAFPVRPSGVTEEEHVVGDQARAWDGTLLSSRRGQKRELVVESAPMARTAADTWFSTLRSLDVLTVDGAYVGSVPFFARAWELERDMISLGQAEPWFHLKFRIREV